MGAEEPGGVVARTPNRGEAFMKSRLPGESDVDRDRPCVSGEASIVNIGIRRPKRLR